MSDGGLERVVARGIATKDIIVGDIVEDGMVTVG